jgi:predicted AAA+ superfamily ATPase
MMDNLIEKHWNRVNNIDLKFVRSIFNTIDWNERLIGIKGARGVGKTTLLLQYIKLNQPSDNSFLYASLDNLWFTENHLMSLVDTFVKQGGQHLFLDEVHKYPNWAQELKNCYDDYPQLKVVFTGSSLLEILNARADLSRRAIVYSMQGLSFREFLNMTTGSDLKSYTLDEVLFDHIRLSNEVISQIKPLQYFNDYLKFGYYPFYKESPKLYHQRLEEVLNMILEIELPLMRSVDIAYIVKIKQMLQIIAESVPFIPNVSKLSEKIGINRITFLTYLHYLKEVKVLNSIFKDAGGISKLQKPDKLFLENTNLAFALAPENANKGNLRETFFVNQLSYSHIIEFPEQGDFFLDNKYTVEVGGQDKTQHQLKGLKDAFIAADDIEFGNGNRIPLWLFGFLY